MELINNILKHSGATQGYLTIQENNKILQITIEDNGKGFDTSTFYILEGFELTKLKPIKALKELLKSIPKSI
jgi:signal transduction histidine kinase